MSTSGKSQERTKTMSFPLRLLHARRLAAIFLVAGSLAACPTSAQPADHLECYRGHDDIRLNGIVDIDSTQFGLTADCRIKKARLFCAPAKKSVVEVNVGPILPVFGGPVPGDFICYQVRCPRSNNPSQTVTDQFGTRVFKLNRASFLLCTPAVKGTEFCGDGMQNGSESCDGTDAARCPGACQPDCTCAPGTPGPRFVDNGDGTVTDNQTGLQWEKKENPGGPYDPATAGPHDVRNHYHWCAGQAVVGYVCDNGTGAPDGSAFTDFLWKLNGGTSSDGSATSGCFANHCDWRLPTIEELQTILLATYPNPCGANPCTDPIFGPVGPSTPRFYWSATALTGNPLNAWGVLFANGAVGEGEKNGVAYVRAVRGGS